MSNFVKREGSVVGTILLEVQILCDEIVTWIIGLEGDADKGEKRVAVKCAFEQDRFRWRNAESSSGQSPAAAFRKIEAQSISTVALCLRIKSESGGFLNPHLRRLFLLIQTHIFASL